MALKDFLHSSIKKNSEPVFFDLGKNADQKALEKLFEKGDVKHVSDNYQEQLKELFIIKNPPLALDGGLEKEFEEYLRSLTKSRSLPEQGKWVFFPWLHELVHILDDDDFQKVRTARNKNLITEEEQKKFYKTTVGIAGLSVGNSIALAIVLEGGARHIKLADHDTLELSNLNRIRAGVDSLGIPKVEMTARQIYLLNPYAKVEIFPEGLTMATFDSFVSGVDILIDEVDQFDIKYQLRKAARSLKIPILMATDNAEGIIVDIERYDLDPETDFFHGRFGSIEKTDLENLEKKDAGFLIAWHVELENISTRMLSSQQEIGKTLVSWPQLGEAALMNGVAMAHAVKAISCGEKISGRALFSFENFFSTDTLIKTDEPVRHEREIPSMQSAADPLSKIINAALLAPSGDNIQPWKIHRSNGGFTVTLDASKDSSLYNTGNRAGFIALGALIENAAITAQSLNTLLTCNEDFVEGTVMCTLRSDASDQTLALLAQEIPNRVTNRNQFEKRVLSPDVKEFLRQNTFSSFVSGVEFKIIDAPCQQLTSAVSKNEKLLFENQKMHHAFFETLRWEPATWGLPIDTLALPLPGLLVFKLAKNWDRFKKYNALLNFSDVIPKQTAALYNHAGAYIVILGERSDNQSFYHAGRLLERLWLASTAQGLSIQPMTGIIFLHHGLSIDPHLALSKTEQDMVENSYDAMQKAAGTKKHILFALRIGYCSTPAPHSPRQSEAELSF